MRATIMAIVAAVGISCAPCARSQVAPCPPPPAAPPPELAAWATPTPVIAALAAPATSIRPGQGYVVHLADVGTIAFAQPPAEAPARASRGGMLELTVATAGTTSGR